MFNWRKERGSFSFWLLTLVLLAVREIQTAYHKHEMKHIEVGTSRTLLDFINVALIDDIQWASFYKSNNQTVMKAAWITEAMGTNSTEEMRHMILNHERDYQFVIQYFTKNDTKTEMPPEVYVSRQDFPNGTISLSCTATGFYPPSILLHWKNGIDGAIRGKESSSGTLPNSDDTFYVRISLEIQPGDTGTGYACVVDHSQLETPVVYFVPEKSSKRNLWAVALSILLESS